MKKYALILLYNKNKEILLQHRDDDAPTLPGYWAFFGGGIEPEELPEQAIIRETKEELCYNLNNPKLVMVQDFETKDMKGKKFVFMEQFDEKQEIVQKEGQGMQWFKPENTSQLKMINHDAEVLKKIKNKY